MKPLIVLDTSAFIAGYEASLDSENYTTPSVKEELEEAGLLHIRLEAAIETGRIKIMEPEERYINQVRLIAAELGEIGKLSEADIDVLSLGLQFKVLGRNPLIISDDYSLQNIADKIGLNYRSMTTHGIKHRIRWEIYCPGCREVLQNLRPNAPCPICGTRLKRRPIEKESIKR
ncbi:MAG: hypothetical protein QW486_03530 [Candidatus Bathyarchaeia archaeon]|nr:hypothetical protein [Candidatus Bathyarchaeota archaeon]